MAAIWEDPRVISGLERQLANRHMMLARGARPVGWKVGFGAPASLQLMEISAPLMGYLTDQTVLEPGATIEASGWERGIVEFEVAVRLGSGLGAGTTDEQAREAVAAVAPAIEVANINLPLEPGRVSDIMAADIFHEFVIFGQWDLSRACLDLEGLSAEVTVDGAAIALTSDLEAITGPYPWIISKMARTLASRDLRLRAGDVIITGSVIPPIPVSLGHEFRFRLDPLPEISVNRAA